MSAGRFTPILRRYHAEGIRAPQAPRALTVEVPVGLRVRLRLLHPRRLRLGEDPDPVLPLAGIDAQTAHSWSLLAAGLDAGRLLPRVPCRLRVAQALPVPVQRRDARQLERQGLAAPSRPPLPILTG